MTQCYPQTFSPGILDRSSMGSGGSKSGFTLLEMIISMTILSLVVLTLYVAFSLGVDVWQRMEASKTLAERKAVALRLLQEDFAAIRPYTWNSSKGNVLFFAGGPGCMFYVTTNGLGARNRSGQALFFTCLYVQPAAEGDGNTLYVYKNGLPEPDLLDAVRDFRSRGDMQRTNYVPPEIITENSVPVLPNVQDGQFHYQEQAYPAFSGVRAEVEGDWEQNQKDTEILAESEWVRNELPGQISFAATDSDDGLLVRSVLAQSPPLNHAKR